MPVTTSNGNSLVVVGDASVDNIKIDGNTVSVTNTNGSIIVQSNGTGALQRDSGGDARGQYAVDLQNVRSSSTKVAAGNYSVVGGGFSNNAIGYYSTVSGGRHNTASGYTSTVGGGNSNDASDYGSTVGGGISNDADGSYSTVGGGFTNNAIGFYSTVGGGRDNDASGYSSTVGGGWGNDAIDLYSTVGGGYNNTASSYLSTVSGGRDNTASGKYATVVGGIDGVASLYGEEARSSGKFNTSGDAQIRNFILRNKTSNNHIVNLFLNGSTQEIVVPENSTWVYTIKIVGRNASDTESAGYKIEGVIESSPLGALLLSKSKTVLAEDNANWDVDVSIDETGASPIFRITTTVESDQNDVSWVAYVEVVQVIAEASIPSYS